MEAKTKKTLLIFTVIILLVINISALITIFYNNNIKEERQLERNEIQSEMEIRGMHRFLKEELMLSEEQYNLFRETYQENIGASYEIAQKLNIKRQEMIEEIAKINPNYENLDKIAHEIGELHYQLKTLTINHLLQLKEICNEDQRESLNKLYYRMLYNPEFESNRRGPGHRNRGGRDRQPKRPRH